MIKVYGVPGWGSTISELMLTLADIPYQFVDVSGFDHEGTSRELLKTLNPLCQIPTLALENDEIMCNQVNHLIPTRVLVKGGEITCKILK